MFPIAKSERVSNSAIDAEDEFAFIAAVPVTIISGNDVPIETIVNPMITSAIPNFRAIHFAPTTKKSAEIISSAVEIINIVNMIKSSPIVFEKACNISIRKNKIIP